MDQELIQLLDEFINLLDNSALIKEIKLLKNRIKNNPDISKLLKDKEEVNDLVSFRQALFQYDDVREYLLKENELNILILSINQQLKPLINRKGCSKCG